jgi:hypothetical protein
VESADHEETFIKSVFAALETLEKIFTK